MASYLLGSDTPSLDSLTSAANYVQQDSTGAYYRVLRWRWDEWNMGDIGLGDAVKKVVDNGRIPRNRLEESWIRRYNSKDISKGLVQIYLSVEKLVYEMRPTEEYLYSLDKEYDAEKFIQLLLLREAAGIYLNERPIETRKTIASRFQENPPTVVSGVFSYGVNPLTGENMQYDLLKGPTTYRKGKDDWNFREEWHDRIIPSWSMSGGPTDPDAPLPGQPWDVQALKGQAYRYITYKGWRYRQAIIDVVMRFRERCMSTLLRETMFMLDVARLEDLDTVVTVYNALMNGWRTIYNRIGGSDAISLIGPDGNMQVVSVKLSDANFSFLIPGATGKYATEYVSIEKALKLQFESVAWLVICNKTKLEGRISQLSDSQIGQLKSQAVIPWQEDPFQNPFLLFDDRNLRFINVAANASGQVALREVASRPMDFIPTKNLLDAPNVFLKYNRILSPTGVSYSTADKNPDKSAAPLWLAAAAAAGIYFMNR